MSSTSLKCKCQTQRKREENLQRMKEDKGKAVILNGLICHGWVGITKKRCKVNIATGRERQTAGRDRLKEVKLGLIHTMTNRINPPSLEEGRGWWGFKLRQALQ